MKNSLNLIVGLYKFFADEVIVGDKCISALCNFCRKERDPLRSVNTGGRNPSISIILFTISMHRSSIFFL
jgi:hypothetical protein